MDKIILFLLSSSSVELHRPGYHGGSDLHQFPAAVVRLRDQPAGSRAAPPALRVRPGLRLH